MRVSVAKITLSRTQSGTAMIKRISIGLLWVTGFAAQAQTVNVRGAQF
jgi:hypothetical protein